MNSGKKHFDSSLGRHQRVILSSCGKKAFWRRLLDCSVLLFLLVAGLSGPSSVRAAEPGTIQLDAGRKLVTLAEGQGRLALRLNYQNGCILDQVIVHGKNVSAASGVASGIRLDGQWFTSRTGLATPQVALHKNTLTVTGIEFGKPGGEQVRETWKFTVQADRIVWRITRNYSTNATLEDAAFPEWDFNSMSAWTGGLLDNGGVVWNKYLETTNATYGAHANTVTFWNYGQPGCLRIIPTIPKNQHGTVRFTHQPDKTFSFNYVVSGDELKPKHNLRRFLSDRQDLWAPFPVKSGEVSVEFALQSPNYDQVCNRGVFQGLDGGKVDELLNTVARYGVIDKRLTGGNGWRSGYICLHEQFFGEIGLALDDPDYTANFSQGLDYERDHAVGPDGRVKSRWTYTAGDAMRGTYDSLGFYEAQWGWLMDSQPDYVINVAEQFNLTGDQRWLAGQKTACERALDFLLRREVQHTGLVAMMTDSHTQKRASDWIDIIWASYENALVNAELYDALGLWSNAETTLGDPTRAAAYRAFAARLKTSFNRPVTDGGFWDPTNQWYAYWREPDGSIHGDNLVTPVNFAAIGYGLCDDATRRKAILDRMETEMQKESLFIWPLSFFPYQREEGAPSNFPFPKYENGDLFLSWGELGVRAYAAYDPALALKYVRKTLARYDQDGLSFQRYLRKSQQGSGNDILAGNCMPVVGLYRDIYGIQPQPNRLYLAPHLTGELNGTQLRYQLRGRLYVVDLDTARCAITAAGCTLRGSAPFGVNATDSGLEYYPGANADWAMSVSGPVGHHLTIQIENWPDDPDAPRQWTETATQVKTTILHVVTHLRPNAIYELTANSQTMASLPADQVGRIRFKYNRGYAVPQRFELRLARQSSQSL